MFKKCSALQNGKPNEPFAMMCKRQAVYTLSYLPGK